MLLSNAAIFRIVWHILLKKYNIKKKKKKKKINRRLGIGLLILNMLINDPSNDNNKKDI